LRTTTGKPSDAIFSSWIHASTVIALRGLRLVECGANAQPELSIFKADPATPCTSQADSNSR
jgi:hypothetical protein